MKRRTMSNVCVHVSARDDSLTFYSILFLTHSITRRQASDQLYDGGGANREGPGTVNGDDDLDIMFSPAEHTDSLKRRKDKKRRNKLNSVSSNTSNSGGSRKSTAPDAASTPRVKNSNRSSYGSPQQQSPNQQYSSPSSQRSGGSRNGNTPPSSTSQRRPPKAGNNGNTGNHNGSNNNMNMEVEDDVWYAKWWMFCFPDTVQNMSPKR
jgi:hypothetical protein